MAAFPTEAEAMRIRTMTDLRLHYQVDLAVWQAVAVAMGNPGEDIRPFAALPAAMVALACESADNGGQALTAIQASQVGLMFRLARRIYHVKNGGSWDQWEDPHPWEAPVKTSDGGDAGTVVQKSLEPKMKMTHILDQGDETEFVVEPEEKRALWVANYVKVVGGLPPEEEEPSME